MRRTRTTSGNTIGVPLSRNSTCSRFTINAFPSITVLFYRNILYSTDRAGVRALEAVAGSGGIGSILNTIAKFIGTGSPSTVRWLKAMLTTPDSVKATWK